MAKVVWHERDVERSVGRRVGGALGAAAAAGRAFAKPETPVRTGEARRSVYGTVYDESGQVVAGDRRDENGVAVPAGQSGALRGRTGANAPHFIWLEIGARGRPGRAILGRALGAMVEAFRRALGPGGAGR